ncbi:MAG: FapA family protein [Chitinispirillia bacterium]|nr:FapA family protein [Chitinispirillia bacterium]MCL2268250.1 FapA family protein [Chitinispirillia bacterium]
MADVTNNIPDDTGGLPDFIDIDVRVAPDRMSAHMHLHPVEGAAGTLTLEHLRAALNREEIARGIDIAALRNVVDDWNRRPRELETQPIARGGAASAAKIGALKVAVRCLSAPGDVTLLLSSKYYWQIASLAAKFQRVDHGTIVARRAAGSPSLLGYNIFGKAIEPEVQGTGQPQLKSIQEHGNVFVAGNTYTASATGIAYIDPDEEIPKVHPIDFDSSVEVRVFADKMSAELVLTPAGERGKNPSEEAIRTALKQASVLHGINEEELRVFLARFTKSGAGITTPQSIVVARGVPAVQGADGYVDFSFNVNSAPTPTLNPDGSADYRNINIVTSVAAGTLLAQLIAPQSGTPGRDLAGRTLPALHGSPAKLPVGTNTMISPEDPTTLVAVSDGIVRFDGSAVNISEGYMIPGGVDYSTGNVNYEGSVGVNGDIKAGFDVYCGGDLQVNGLVEDCKVTVKGHVLCRYGFVGNGRGIIDAGGDVNLVYVKNQTVVSGGTVSIAKEAINSSITARKSIKIYGHNLSVAGGTLAANESITIKTAGNISGVKTIIQIVPEPELVAQLESFRTMTAQHEENIRKLSATLDTLPPAKRIDKEFVRKLKNAIIMIKQEVLNIEEKMRTLMVEMNKFDNSFIRIDRCAYPGTIFSIGPRNMIVTEQMNGGKTLRLIDQEIKVI